MTHDRGAVLTSRRQVLAAGAAGLLASAGAGCSELLGGFTREAHADADWPMFQFDAANTGHTPARGPTGDVTVSWRWEDEREAPPRGPPPAVAGGTLYVGGPWLSALDADAGERQWQAPLGWHGTPAVTDGTVVASRQAPSVALTGFDAESGEERWQRPDVRATSAPAVVEGTVYVSGASREAYHVYAVDAATGEREWRYDGERFFTAPAVADDTVFVGERGYRPDQPNEPTFYALDAATGEERWRVDLTYVAPPVVADGRVYAAAGSTLYALDADSGEQDWAIDEDLPRGAVLFPTVADGTLYVTGDAVVAYDAASGSEQWRTDLVLRGRDPTVTGDTLYATDGAGQVYALATDDGAERWRLEVASPGGNVDDEVQRESAPAISAGVAYGVDVSGTVYALEEA